MFQTSLPILRNLQTGSIVCSYTIGQINEAFDQGPYLVYNRDERTWHEEENLQYSVSYLTCPDPRCPLAAAGRTGRV